MHALRAPLLRRKRAKLMEFMGAAASVGILSVETRRELQQRFDALSEAAKAEL